MFKKINWSKWKDVAVQSSRIRNGAYCLIQVREDTDTGRKQFKSRTISTDIYHTEGISLENITQEDHE